MTTILQHWLQQNPHPRTTEPFLLVLKQLHAETTNNGLSTTTTDTDSNATATATATTTMLSTLDQWGDLMGGHLELAPPLSAFHLVLDATTTSAQVGRDILRFLEQEHLQGNYTLAPTVETYSLVIGTTTTTIHHAENNTLRQQQQQQQQQSNDYDLVVKLQDAFENTKDLTTPAAAANTAYHYVRGYSKALAACPNPTDAMQWFQDFETTVKKDDGLLLQQALLVEENPEQERVVSLLGKMYQSVLSILVDAPVRKLKNAQRSKEMIDYLASLQLDDLPWVEHYSLVVQCWATDRSFIQNKADEVLQELLQRFEEQHLVGEQQQQQSSDNNNNNRRRAQLPIKVYERIVWMWSHTNKASEAEELLHHVMRLMEHKQLKSTSPKQVAKMWDYVMMAHFKEKKPQRVVRLWDRMDGNIVPKTAVSYSAILKAISRLPNSDAVRKASRVWEELLANPDVDPTANHYGSLISTWARSSSHGAADYALEILEELEARHAKDPDNEYLKPMEAHYSAVIAAFSRSYRDHRAVDKATKVFNRMKEFYQPDTITYSSFISALANGRSVECAETAEELLEEMEMLAELPDGHEVKPNAVTYTAVLQAWAKSGSPQAAEKAERILDLLETKYRETGDEMLQPDSVAYGALINAWSRMRRPDAGARAEAILIKVKKMEAVSGTSLLNTVIYTNVMLAHWKSNKGDSARKAEALLREMLERAAEGDHNCIPDTISYTTVIQAWARSKAPDKFSKAWDMLTEMCEGYQNGNLPIRPNVITFTAVLNACAFARGDDQNRQKAVETALMAMNEYQSHDYDAPSPIMYATLLKVFGHQVKDPKNRFKYSSIAFQRCCQDGQVDDSIIKLLQEYVPALYRQLPRNKDKQVDLPPEWTMNING